MKRTYSSQRHRPHQAAYDGLGRLRIRREYTWGSGGSGGDIEVSKSGMTLSGSGTCSGWDYSFAKDNLTADPGWVNCSYTSANEFLRVDLGSSHNVSHVAYEPRVMLNDGGTTGTWNGVYKNYAIYVTDNAGSDPAYWGAPVASGTWTWPNLQERKDVTFAPKMGRYVYFLRVSGYGWWTELGNPGYAGANEIWVYESGTGGSGAWALASETRYLYDGKLVVQERDALSTPLVTYTRGKDLSGSLDGAGGIGGLLTRSTGSSGGSGDAEVSKSVMTLSGSGTCSGWDYAFAKDNLTTDPGWVNCTYTAANEFLRVDLGSRRNVSHVAYMPRVMQNDGGSGGTWNGVYKDYAIYVTDDSSGNPANWGATVASGRWTWPNLQERKDVTFTPKMGRYVYFLRVSGYGWYSDSNPGYAGANEIWVFESTGGGGGGAGDVYYHADGNGNITCLVDVNQAIVANYKYDPYGRTIGSSGSLAAANVYRFSSKELHAKSGMYYYLYRFYDPNTQRWITRDPIGERGGFNLYTFGFNSPINVIDFFGLDPRDIGVPRTGSGGSRQNCMGHALCDSGRWEEGELRSKDNPWPEEKYLRDKGAREIKCEQSCNPGEKKLKLFEWKSADQFHIVRQDGDMWSGKKGAGPIYDFPDPDKHTSEAYKIKPEDWKASCWCYRCK